MSLFKRLSATLVSRIDQVVGEIENHDAVIQVALNDMRKKIAEARVPILSTLGLHFHAIPNCPDGYLHISRHNN